MTFRSKFEMIRESDILKERTEAGDNFAKMEFMCHPTELNLLALELRSFRYLFIDGTIQLPSIAV